MSFAPPSRHRSPSARQSGAVVAIDREGLAKAGFIVSEGPGNGIAEEFRLIKHELLADIEKRSTVSEERRRSVLICSAQPRAGKTFCSINLALSLAGERDVEIVLVEADFPKPDLLKTLGIADDGPGFVDLLADRNSDPEDFLIRTDVPGLSVLPAGRKTNNVPELLASDRTREVLAKLVAGDRRRIILFDSPPALMASHATVLGRPCRPGSRRGARRPDNRSRSARDDRPAPRMRPCRPRPEWRGPCRHRAQIRRL